jgi:hypothetical protein
LRHRFALVDLGTIGVVIARTVVAAVRLALLLLVARAAVVVALRSVRTLRTHARFRAVGEFRRDAAAGAGLVREIELVLEGQHRLVGRHRAVVVGLARRIVRTLALLRVRLARTTLTAASATPAPSTAPAAAAAPVGLAPVDGVAARAAAIEAAAGGVVRPRLALVAQGLAPSAVRRRARAVVAVEALRAVEPVGTLGTVEARRGLAALDRRGARGPIGELGAVRALEALAARFAVLRFSSAARLGAVEAAGAR